MPMMTWHFMWAPGYNIMLAESTGSRRAFTDSSFRIIGNTIPGPIMRPLYSIDTLIYIQAYMLGYILVKKEISLDAQALKASCVITSRSPRYY
jgi:hypothetical protein